MKRNRLAHLKLSGFRNLADSRLELPPEGVAITGANAQGKSNLLEAIYYLETFRSFRGSRDAQLVRFEESVFRVEGEVGELTVAAGYDRSTRQKKVVVDGREPERLGEAIGRLGVVLFTPNDVRLISDGPQERRRFLDVVLSLSDPAYLEAAQHFRKVLLQRNAALREGAPGASVGAWDDQLVRWGGDLMQARARWIEEGAQRFRSLYEGISGAGSGSLSYQPGVPAPLRREHEDGDAAAADWPTLYREALGATRERERKRGTTVVGPHRDELLITVEARGGERDARDFGSGGQQRTAALALRLMEAETVRERRDREPIFLMDDVFAELDDDRSERLLDLLDRTAVGQVLLTAPKESDVRFRGDRLPRWRIESGRVTG